ncbi:hypothetical protein [Phormidium nigroviride]
MDSLEPEEKNLLDSVENQEWQSLAKLGEALEKYRKFAQHHINILAEVPKSTD